MGPIAYFESSPVASRGITRGAPPVGRRRVIALDGKTVRGSASDTAEARHLLAAIDHRSAMVLGQVNVERKTNVIPMFGSVRAHRRSGGRGHHHPFELCDLLTERGEHRDPVGLAGDLDLPDYHPGVVIDCGHQMPSRAVRAP